MSNFDTFQLTHPELMSATELREILRNRCIDFGNSEQLSRSELIELYKRIALPLPQRRQDNNQNSDSDVNSIDEPHRDLVVLNVNKSGNERPRTSQSCGKRANTSFGDLKQVSTEVSLTNSRKETACNSVHKRSNDGRCNNESPSKKRQKITWP